MAAWLISLPGRVLRRTALLLLAAYRLLLSPFFFGRCRFYPSCSQYATIAFTRLPFWRALLLTAHRLGRCHPLCQGGEDWPPLH